MGIADVDSSGQQLMDYNLVGSQPMPSDWEPDGSYSQSYVSMNADCVSGMDFLRIRDDRILAHDLMGMQVIGHGYGEEKQDEQDGNGGGFFGAPAGFTPVHAPDVDKTDSHHYPNDIEGKFHLGLESY